jgi:hypothetical protein
VLSASFNDPNVVDRLAAGNGLPEVARENAVSMARFYVQSPEPLMDSVLADFRSILNAQVEGDSSV